MKEIKLRIKSVESTMQITKAMELVASSKLRRAKERVENSRPYFETLYATLFDIAAADSEFNSPYLAKCEKKCCLYIVIAGDRGLAGGYNSNILKAFTQFISMLTQTAIILPVLPFDAEPPEPGHEHQSLMLYEPDSAAVFDAIIPEYLAGVVYGALCESVASEQGARRTAMDSATKNAGEMIEHLNLYYNRARQAAITQEITEIVAGADAES